MGRFEEPRPEHDICKTCGHYRKFHIKRRKCQIGGPSTANCSCEKFILGKKDQ